MYHYCFDLPQGKRLLQRRLLDGSHTLYRAGVAECACCKVKGRAGQEVVKCRHGGCGQYFHPHCLRALAQTSACLQIHNYTPAGSPSQMIFVMLQACPPFHYCHWKGVLCMRGVPWKCMACFLELYVAEQCCVHSSWEGGKGGGGVQSLPSLCVLELRLQGTPL